MAVGRDVTREDLAGESLQRRVGGGCADDAGDNNVYEEHRCGTGGGGGLTAAALAPAPSRPSPTPSRTAVPQVTVAARWRLSSAGPLGTATQFGRAETRACGFLAWCSITRYSWVLLRWGLIFRGSGLAVWGRSLWARRHGSGARQREHAALQHGAQPPGMKYCVNEWVCVGLQISEAARARGNGSMRLSSMVLNHQVQLGVVTMGSYVSGFRACSLREVSLSTATRFGRAATRACGSPAWCSTTRYEVP